MPITGLATGARGFGMFGSVQLAPRYFISVLGASGTDVSATGCSVSANGSFVAFSAVTSSSSFIGTLTPSGQIGWQRSLLFDSGDPEMVVNVKVSPSGAIFAAGRTTVSSASNAFVARLEANGNLVWARRFAESGSFFEQCDVDGNDNVYITGATSSDTLGILGKISSSGDIQWMRTINRYNREIARGVAVDSSGTVLFSGQTHSSDSGSWHAFFQRYATDGTNNFNACLNGTVWFEGWGAAHGLNGDMYFSGKFRVGGIDDRALVFKMNSSGVIQWTSMFATGLFQAQIITADSSGNVYMLASTNTTPSSVLFKFNSSGTLLWQRGINLSFSSFGHLDADSADGVVVGGTSTESPKRAVFMRLPADGSKTGNYTVGGLSISYQPSSFTSASASLNSLTNVSISNWSPSSATTGWSVQNSSLTQSSSVLP